MRRPGWLLAWALVIGTAACAPRGESASSPPVAAPAPDPVSPADRAAAADPAGSSLTAPRSVDESSPLEEGRVVFVGMVRPTKGGHEVRGVVLDDDALPRALADGAPESGGGDADALLGAKVRITADLVRHAPSPRAASELAVPTRSGPWLGVRRLEKVELVAPPATTEGTIGRSKGLYQVGEHLVRREDLDWSLASSSWKEGDRVRLWGQPRVVVCDPRAQCLLGGSIPMFEVGRARKLP